MSAEVGAVLEKLAEWREAAEGVREVVRVGSMSSDEYETAKGRLDAAIRAVFALDPARLRALAAMQAEAGAGAVQAVAGVVWDIWYGVTDAMGVTDDPAMAGYYRVSTDVIRQADNELTVALAPADAQAGGAAGRAG